MAEENNNSNNKNKKTVPIVVGTVCVLGIGGFLAYNHYASTNTALILNSTAGEFKNESQDIIDSNNVITSAKTILSDDYTIKVGTETDDMFIKLDYNNETNMYNGLISAYGFSYNLDLGELPYSLTTNGFEYTGQAKTMLDEVKTKYTSSLGSLFLASEVSNEKSDKLVYDDSKKTYDREIKFVINKDELNTLMSTYNQEMSDITKNQIIPEIIQQVKSSLGIPIDASAIEESLDFVTGFYGSLADTGLENDVEVTLYTDNKRVKEVIVSTLADGKNDKLTIFFNDVDNYLNSEITVVNVSEDATTGDVYLDETIVITTVLNKDVWSVTLNASETSLSSVTSYSANYTWNLNETANNLIFVQNSDGEIYNSTSTLAVDENQNIYYNKPGEWLNIKASLSSNVVTE